jgi:hypothetical protein
MKQESSVMELRPKLTGRVVSRFHVAVSLLREDDLALCEKYLVAAS